jgi:hypothetical protein
VSIDYSIFDFCLVERIQLTKIIIEMGEWIYSAYSHKYPKRKLVHKIIFEEKT